MQVRARAHTLTIYHVIIHFYYIVCLLCFTHFIAFPHILLSFYAIIHRFEHYALWSPLPLLRVTSFRQSPIVVQIWETIFRNSAIFTETGFNVFLIKINWVIFVHKHRKHNFIWKWKRINCQHNTHTYVQYALRANRSSARFPWQLLWNSNAKRDRSRPNFNCDGTDETIKSLDITRPAIGANEKQMRNKSCKTRWLDELRGPWNPGCFVRHWRATGNMNNKTRSTAKQPATLVARKGFYCHIVNRQEHLLISEFPLHYEISSSFHSFDDGNWVANQGSDNFPTNFKPNNYAVVT